MTIKDIEEACELHKLTLIEKLEASQETTISKLRETKAHNEFLLARDNLRNLELSS